jgi:MFS family permease
MTTAELALPRAHERTLSTAWWTVVARFLLHGLIVSSWVSRIPAIQSELGLGNAELGLCLLGTAVGSVAAIPTTGWLIGQRGSKRVASLSTVGFALALIGPAFAVGPITLFLALMLFGAMAGANDVSINAQGIALEHAMAAPVMSRFHAMFSIGGMVGAAAGGLIAEHGVTPHAHLLAVSIFLACAAVITGPYLFEAHDEKSQHTQRMAVRHIPKVLFALAAVATCMFLSEGAMADWSGVYLKQTLHANHALAAAAYAVFSCGMAIFRLLGDALTKRLGPVRTLRMGALVSAAGLTLALCSTSATGALPGFALTGAGFSVVVPLAFAASGRVAGVPREFGIAMVSGSGYFGFLFGPPLIGLLAQATTLRVTLFLIVGLSLLASLLAYAVDTTEAKA